MPKTHIHALRSHTRLSAAPIRLTAPSIMQVILLAARKEFTVLERSPEKATAIQATIAVPTTYFKEGAVSPTTNTVPETAV